MSKHTAGPWIAQQDDGSIKQPFSIYSKVMSSTNGVRYTDDPVALYMKGSDAQHIVLCVNEFAGIPQDKIDGFMENVKYILENGECYQYEVGCANRDIIRGEWCSFCHLEALSLFPE